MAPFVCCLTDCDRMSNDQDVDGAGEERLKESGLRQVRRRFLDQDGFVEVPVPPPCMPERPAVVLGVEWRFFRQVRIRREGEAAGTTVVGVGRVDQLQVLSLILSGAGVLETTDLRVLGDPPCQQGRSAAVKAPDEDQLVLVDLRGIGTPAGADPVGLGLPEIPNLGANAGLDPQRSDCRPRQPANSQPVQVSKQGADDGPRESRRAQRPPSMK